MLRSPRRLPQRFNRRVTDQTRSLAKRRYQRRKQMLWQRMQRLWSRFQRKGDALKSLAIRFAIWVVAIVVIVALAIVFFSPLFQVREIRIVRDDARIDIERVQHLLSPLFGRHLLFLSSQELLPLLVNGQPAIANRPAQAGIPDVASIQVEMRYPSTIVLHLTLDPLIARLQITPNAGDTAPKAGTGSKTADYLTSKGIYVTYSPDQVGTGAQLPMLKIVDWSTSPAPFGQLITPELLKAMNNAERALAVQFGQPTRARTIYVRGQEFHLLTPQFSLWFDVKSPLETQLLRYRVFLQALGKTAAHEYVDLRLTDRVIYK